MSELVSVCVCACVRACARARACVCVFTGSEIPVKLSPAGDECQTGLSQHALLLHVGGGGRGGGGGTVDLSDTLLPHVRQGWGWRGGWGYNVCGMGRWRGRLGRER